MESHFRPELVGLREREAKVYLAALELGSSTAQQIAVKTGIQRGSAYAAIGILKKRGMMYESTKGKKQYFNAEKPTQLLQLIQDEKKRLQKREEELKASLPMLEALAISSERMDIKRFEGWDGLESIRNILLASKTKTFEIVQFAAGADSIWTPKFKKAGFKLKQINVGSQNDAEKIKSEIAIIGDFIAIITYHEQPQGCLIKSKDASQLLKLAYKNIT